MAVLLSVHFVLLIKFTEEKCATTPVERIEKDLENLKKNFNAKTIIFQDDHLMSDRDRVLKSKGIKKLDLKQFSKWTYSLCTRYGNVKSFL